MSDHECRPCPRCEHCGVCCAQREERCLYCVIAVQDEALDLAKTRLEEWVAWSKQARCAYCGDVHARPDDMDEADALIKAHIESCEKHPFHETRRELHALRQTVEAHGWRITYDRTTGACTVARWPKDEESKL